MTEMNIYMLLSEYQGKNIYFVDFKNNNFLTIRMLNYEPHRIIYSK